MRYVSLFALLCGLAACSGKTPGFDIPDQVTPFDKEAAEQEADTSAIDNFERGTAYHHGLGAPVNHEIAETYYRQAIANDSDTRAMNELAILLLDESTQPAQRKEAFSLFEQAARAGNAAARFNLGIAYYTGIGLERSAQRGLDFIATAANQGNTKAQSFMTSYVRNQARDDAADNAAVADLLQGWADEGSPSYWEIASANTNYADLWERFFETRLEDRSTMLSDVLAVESGCDECVSGDADSIGRKLDEIQHWRDQADRGDRSGQFNLGLAYLEGNGTPKNVEQGARLIIKAAEGGYVPAQYVLGKLYLEGRGIMRNPQMAYAWFNIAASHDSGYREGIWAAAMREIVEAKLSTRDVSKGQEWSTSWLEDKAPR